MAGLSLRQRLLLLVGIALVPSIAILTWEELDLRRARQAEVRELALRYAQLAASETNSILNGVETLLLAVGRAPVVRQDEAACSRYLSDVRATAPAVMGLAVLDRAGSLRCHSDEDGTMPAPEHLAEVLRTGQFTVGVYRAAQGRSGPSLPLAAPLRDADGAIGGVMLAELDLGWFGERMRERGLAAGGALTVADRGGVLLMRHPMPERFVGTRIPPAFLGLLSAPGPGVQELTSQDGTRRTIGYLPLATIPYGLYVSAGISHDVAFAAFDRARAVTLSAMVGCSVVAFILAWAVGQRFIQRPVERMLGSIRAWRGGDMTARTGMSAAAGELGAVGAAIDGLVQELEAREAARDEAERHRAMLMGELTHRVKNMLSIVQALAAQSFRGSAEPAAARAAFDARLKVLANAHSMLIAENWEAADIADVVQQALELHRGPEHERIAACGPRLRLQSRAALALSLALHELATNALKYGALSVEGGRVDILWSISADCTRRFRLTWTEHGGPAVQDPGRAGFGSQLIKGALAAELGGTVRLSYAAAGLKCEVDAPVASVAAPA